MRNQVFSVNKGRNSTKKLPEHEAKLPTAGSRLLVQCYNGEMQISHPENGDHTFLRNANTHFPNYTSHIPEDRRCNIY